MSSQVIYISILVYLLSVPVCPSSQTYEFEMQMTGDGCSGAAKRVLGKLGDKVSYVETDLETQKVIVTSTLSSDELLETLKKTGKPVKYIGIKE